MHNTQPQPGFTDERLIPSSKHTTLANATTKKGRNHSIDSLKKTWAHTFLQSCYPIYCIVFVCNLHPPPVCLLLSQHCALIESPCEGQSGACCGLGHTEGQTLHNKPALLCSTCRCLHIQTHRHVPFHKWCSTLTAITHRAAGNPRFPRSALTLSPTWRYTSTSVVMAASRTCKQQVTF